MFARGAVAVKMGASGPGEKKTVQPVRCLSCDLTACVACPVSSPGQIARFRAALHPHGARPGRRDLFAGGEGVNKERTESALFAGRQSVRGTDVGVSGAGRRTSRFLGRLNRRIPVKGAGRRARGRGARALSAEPIASSCMRSHASRPSSFLGPLNHGQKLQHAIRSSKLREALSVDAILANSVPGSAVSACNAKNE